MYRSPDMGGGVTKIPGGGKPPTGGGWINPWLVCSYAEPLG